VLIITYLQIVVLVLTKKPKKRIVFMGDVMDRMAIIFKAYEVADEIKSSQAFKDLVYYGQYMQTQLKNEVEAYQKAMVKFNEVQSLGGSYHPDFKQTILTLGVAKRALYEQEAVKKYLAAEKIIQQTLDDLSRDLGQTISSHVKVPNELGLFKENSCHVG
jgi:cell fate (sporulation/competence/biofilm development) regulator YlbF (YheA/YmcA/DUF963 family)